MRVAYLDTIGGIAGDMTLAAFVSAGLPLQELTSRLAALPLKGYELIGRHVSRSGITAVQVEVVVSFPGSHHRHLRDIESIITGSSLAGAVKERAMAAFRVLAAAEAKIHNTTIDKVHFHEVGAVDAIIDIVGTAICLETMGIERIYTSPIKVGNGGSVEAEHGLLPIPSPATMEILRGYPVVLTSAPHELTTPTGAAIVRAFSSGSLSDEELVVDTIGYGAGMKEFREMPNLLRILIGSLASQGEQDMVTVIETTIDDMNPQLYPYVLDQLLASGAVDAYLTPVIMKKGRPGILLSVLTGIEGRKEVVDLIFSLTSTIGLRIQNVPRARLERREVVIDTRFGPLKAKSVLREGRTRISPEFEECRRIAEEQKISLLEVYRLVNQDIAQRTGL
jgi:uncharacterized protein (TIGR00299 family) protein